MPKTATAPASPTLAVSRPSTAVSAERRHEGDAMVARAKTAAEQFRQLDQEQVDRIVLAMVRAGVRAAPELARIAIQETGFGVFEDKVVKNFVATEFLYDYLKDKKTVGVIDSASERGIAVIAEPIGVVLAPFVFILAFMVAHSRVRARIHTWWEVAGGAILGMVITLFVFRMMNLF